jgi:membrane-associated phospholipid phosphatase
MTTDYALRWWVLVAVAVLVAVWFQALGIAFDASSAGPKVAFAALMIGSAVVYAWLAAAWSRMRRPVAVVSDLCLSLAQLVVAISVLLPLTYLAASFALPLWDDRLVRWDAAFGFEWDAAARWIQERPALARILQWSYHSLFYQGAAVLVIGSLTRPGDRNGEAIWLFIVSLLGVTAVSAFTPAIGKVGNLGTGYVDIINEIRSGQWASFTYNRADGIITFPSFHTVLAIILTYVVRQHWWALAFIAPLNALVILSTPTVGGHYLVDLFAGAVVAVIAIFLVQRIRQWIAARTPAVPRGATDASRSASPGPPF